MATTGKCNKCSAVIWNRKSGFCQKCSPFTGRYKRTQKIKGKMSQTRKALFASGELKHPKGMLGKKHTEEVKKRITESLKKRVFNDEALYRKRLSIALTGHKHSQETKDKIAARARIRLSIPENNPAWKGGITPINLKIRNSKEYTLWRSAIFERDNYTCVWCTKHGGYLEADHIKPFAYFPELRFAIDNGRTLCRPCHITTFKENKEYGRTTT